MKEIQQILKFYKKHINDPISMVLATVVNVEDSSYRRIGARMLILENGQWIGGISGGCLEGDVLKHAKKVMSSHGTQMISYDTREGDPYQIGVGLGCEGKIDIFLQPLTKNSQLVNHLEMATRSREARVLITPFGSSSQNNEWVGRSGFSSDLKDEEIFIDGINKATLNKSSIVETIIHKASELRVLFEWIEPNIRLILAGHNYDIYPMISIAKEMGWQIELICKKQKINKGVLSSINRCYGFDELEKIPIDAFTAMVSMAHDYQKDKTVLLTFHQKSLGYLGILGPKKRFRRMCRELSMEENYQDQIYNPVGLDIGSSSPEEIALATIAEIVKHFKGASGTSLKDKTGFIHERAALLR